MGCREWIWDVGSGYGIPRVDMGCRGWIRDTEGGYGIPRVDTVRDVGSGCENNLAQSDVYWHGHQVFIVMNE